MGALLLTSFPRYSVQIKDVKGVYRHQRRWRAARRRRAPEPGCSRSRHVFPDPRKEVPRSRSAEAAFYWRNAGWKPAISFAVFYQVYVHLGRMYSVSVPRYIKLVFRDVALLFMQAWGSCASWLAHCGALPTGAPKHNLVLYSVCVLQEAVTVPAPAAPSMLVLHTVRAAEYLLVAPAARYSLRCTGPTKPLRS